MTRSNKLVASFLKKLYNAAYENIVKKGGAKTMLPFHRALLSYAYDFSVGPRGEHGRRTFPPLRF